MENNNQISVPVTGGRLVADVIPDQNYPGIEIHYVSDFNSATTSLAIVEEADGRFILRSYMDTEREDPESIECNYNQELFLEVAFGLYRIYRNDAMDMDTFKKMIISDHKIMYPILPVKLHSAYRKYLQMAEAIS